MEDNNETGLNWYQIISIIFIVLYFIIPIFMLLEEEIEFTFIGFISYSFIGIVSFMFMYGFGKIINLLSQINDKLNNKITNINQQINKVKKTTKKEKNTNEDTILDNDDIPWELRED